MEQSQSGIVAATEKSLYRNDKLKRAVLSSFGDRVTFWSLSDRQQSDLLYNSCLPVRAVAEAFSNQRLKSSQSSQETSPEDDHGQWTVRPFNFLHFDFHVFIFQFSIFSNFFNF